MRLSKQKQIQILEGQVHALKSEVEAERWKTHIEQGQRIAAQRGLVPYVRSLQAFNEWLGDHPELRDQLEPILRELGLWDIRLAYDPDQDLSLSAVSPHRV